MAGDVIAAVVAPVDGTRLVFRALEVRYLVDNGAGGEVMLRGLLVTAWANTCGARLVAGV